MISKSNRCLNSWRKLTNNARSNTKLWRPYSNSLIQLSKQLRVCLIKSLTKQRLTFLLSNRSRLYWPAPLAAQAQRRIFQWLTPWSCQAWALIASLLCRISNNRGRSLQTLRELKLLAWSLLEKRASEEVDPWWWERLVVKMYMGLHPQLLIIISWIAGLKVSLLPDRCCIHRALIIRLLILMRENQRWWWLICPASRICLFWTIRTCTSCLIQRWWC
jgi:hypothetical protein